MKKKMQNRLDQNTEVMEECITRANRAFNNTFSGTPWSADPPVIGKMAEALFRSVVASASQKEATKRGVDMIDGALKALDSAKPEPIIPGGFSTYPGGMWENLKSQAGPPPSPPSAESYQRCTFCGEYGEMDRVVTFGGMLPICKKCVEKKEKGLPLLTDDVQVQKEEVEEEDEETEKEGAGEGAVLPRIVGKGGQVFTLKAPTQEQIEDGDYTPPSFSFTPFETKEKGWTCDSCGNPDRFVVMLPNKIKEGFSICLCEECVWTAYHSLRAKTG